MDETEFTVTVPRYNKYAGGLRGVLMSGRVVARIVDNEIEIFGDELGLRWLASSLLAISQGDVPSGYHQHFSEDYGLEPESVGLVVGKL